MAKSWEEKFNSDKPWLVKQIDKDFADIPAGAQMLIATPAIIADYLKQIPEGYSTDVKKIRTDLANEYGAEYTCPVTTGIFLRTVAEFGHEQVLAGKALSEIPPFWRAIDQKSNTMKKLSFDKSFITRQRQAEGLPA
ncbi:MAG: hypothetical protein Roseis2KO_40960 [Roseivirga sp.]